MGKINKEFQWRMQGILHAREVVAKDGLEGLDKEIKMRGFLQVPLVYSKGQIDGWWDELSTNLYATMTTVAGMVLREHFGFGKQRLLKFRNEFQNMTKSALDLDYLGSHYVTLEDYANELNEQFDMGIDVSRVRNCQGSYDDTDAKYRTVKLDRYTGISRDTQLRFCILVKIQKHRGSFMWCTNARMELFGADLTGCL